MILTMTRYHENLLRDDPLSLLSVVNSFSSLETKMILKIPNETLLRITLYQYGTIIELKVPLRKSIFKSMMQK